jgi:hypothetical protein
MKTVVLQVRLAPPTEQGRLYPVYLNSIRIFVLESRVRRPWAHRITFIESGMLLDIDEDHVLANVELLGSRAGARVSHCPVCPHRAAPRTSCFPRWTATLRLAFAFTRGECWTARSG